MEYWSDGVLKAPNSKHQITTDLKAQPQTNNNDQNPRSLMFCATLHFVPRRSRKPVSSGATAVKSVLVIEYWNLGFIWNLVLGAWNFAV
jgi:hypothetical protein